MKTYILHQQDCEDQQRRELAIWPNLVHENILPFYGTAEINRTYLLSPWMRHGTLSRFISKRLEFLSQSSAQRTSDPCRMAYSSFKEVDVIHGITSGLAYLHAQGVTHGDLKGRNVLLDDFVEPVIHDFTLATARGTEYQNLPDTLDGAGTQRWMSPEALLGAPRTTKSDMYSFSMTVVEVLTGNKPFSGLNDVGLIFDVALKKARPPSTPLSREGQNFEGLWRLASSCWAHEPQQRLEAAEVLARWTEWSGE